MEYTEMINQVKALAVKNRTAKTEEEKAEIKKQMNSLKEQDPKTFGIALGYLVKVTEKKVEDLTMAEKFGEVTDMVSMAYIAKNYFGKTRGWLSQRMNGNIVNGKPAQFSSEELATLRGALMDMSKRFNSLSLSI